MKMRRLFAAALAATTLLGTALPTMADTTGTSCPNFTAYSNYSEAVIAGDAKTISFSVGGADDTYMPTYMDETEAKGIEWELLDGSIEGVYINTIKTKNVNAQYGWVSEVTVDVESDAEPGLAVVEARKGDVYLDFSISVNADSDTVVSVNSIKNYFYKADGTKAGEYTCDVVQSNDFYGESNYASALDALQRTRFYSGGIVSALTTSGTYVTGIGFNNAPVIAASGSEGWQYRVYSADGKVNALSIRKGAVFLPLLFDI
ncbi:MAG: hypothetical protein V8S26_10305 [Lachnospiraceae bacterium]